MAVTALYVRLVPLANSSAGPSLAFELFTPCVYAEFFGWQPGRGQGINGAVGLNLPTTDWNLYGQAWQSLTPASTTALSGPTGLAVTKFPIGGYVVWALNQALNLTLYQRYKRLKK